jgi:hypothetical protein
MAGSYKHCLTDAGSFRGFDLLENMKDMGDAVEMLFFMVRYLDETWNSIEDAEEAYYSCVRGEQPWPAWMKPGVRA